MVLLFRGFCAARFWSCVTCTLNRAVTGTERLEIVKPHRIDGASFRSRLGLGCDEWLGNDRVSECDPGVLSKRYIGNARHAIGCIVYAAFWSRRSLSS